MNSDTNSGANDRHEAGEEEELTARVGFKVTADTKRRLRKMSAQKSVQADERVSISEVCRSALRLYLDLHERALVEADGSPLVED